MSFYDIDLKTKIAGQHILWEIEKIISFSSLIYRLKDLESRLGRKGYGAEVGLRCMYLQFHYDLSDRQLEERLNFDLAFKWFCGFTAFEETPDHSYFCRFRKLVGFLWGCFFCQSLAHTVFGRTAEHVTSLCPQNSSSL